MNSQEYEYENDEGDLETIELPTRMSVCPECGGHGTVLCDGMRGHAYTAEEFERDFDDEERAEYCKRGGRYDVQCPECNGRNVVAVVDEDRLSEAQKPIYKLICEHAEAAERSRREDELTMRGESGDW